MKNKPQIFNRVISFTNATTSDKPVNTKVDEKKGFELHEFFNKLEIVVNEFNTEYYTCGSHQMKLTIDINKDELDMFLSQLELPPMESVDKTIMWEDKDGKWRNDRLPTVDDCSKIPTPDEPVNKQIDDLEQKLAKDLNHTLKLVPISQRELFVFELARYLSPLIASEKVKELEQMWNSTQPDLVPDGWTPESPEAKYLQKRINELRSTK